jgi:hypothetical protein
MGRPANMSPLPSPALQTRVAARRRRFAPWNGGRIRRMAWRTRALGLADRKKRGRTVEEGETCGFYMSLWSFKYV